MHVEAFADRFSDGGSTPPTSTMFVCTVRAPLGARSCFRHLRCLPVIPVRQRPFTPSVAVAHAETPVCACLSRSRRRQVPRTGRRSPQRKPLIVRGEVGRGRLAEPGKDRSRDTLRISAPPGSSAASAALREKCLGSSSLGVRRPLHPGSMPMATQPLRHGYDGGAGMRQRRR